MSQLLLAAAIFLFLSPSSALSAQPASRSQPATVDRSVHTIEGCVSRIDDDFVLTLPSGRRYELTGDTPLLADRVGHTVRLWGHADSARDAELMVAGQPNFAFGVDKVETLSLGCKVERLHRG